MPGALDAADSSKPSTGGSGGALGGPTAKKKSPSLTDRLWGISKKFTSPKEVGSAALSYVDAPSQIVRHGIKAAGEAVTGDFRAAAGEVGKGALEWASLGQAGGDISFTESLEPLGVKKLPFGLDTAGSILTDPYTYLTGGAGATGRAGLKATRSALGESAEQAVKKKGLKALTKEEQDTVRSHIVEQASLNVSEKEAERVAKSQMRALKSRARGGIGLHVPGTPIDVHLGGSFDQPFEKLAARNPNYAKARALFSPDDIAEEARVSTNLTGKSVKEIDDMAEEALPLFVPKDTAARTGKFLDRMGSDPLREETFPSKLSQAWRRQAVTYPGTVLNRLRQAAFYGAADGQRPDQWVRYMNRGRKNYMAAEKLFRAMKAEGDDLLDLGVEQRLANIIGPDAAREEIMFRLYADAATYFTGTERRLAKTKLGQTAQKAIRPVSKAGEKIRSAGNVVEESSRRANFLHNLEHRYGSFEQAGAHTRRMLPPVEAASRAEEQLTKVAPFWTAMRADWQAVLRMAGESPGRVAALTRVAQNLPQDLQERHMPPLELAKALGIPAQLVTGDIDAALNAISEMTGGPGMQLIEEMFKSWQRDNQDIPRREQWYRFLKQMHPQIRRLPSVVEEKVSGKEVKADKRVSPWEALVKASVGSDVAKVLPQGEPTSPAPPARGSGGGALG